MNVKLKKTDKVKVQSSAEIYDIMRRILLRENQIERAKEHFWTVGLDASLRILYIELISIGGSYNTIVEPMQIFRVGVQKGIIKMLLVHNHPSGSIIPSVKDLDITDRLIQCGHILDIKVVDHLIITENEYMSFADEKLMEQLEKNTAYMPRYKIKADVTARHEATILKRGKRDREREIARSLKQQGIEISTIAKVTGLSETTVKRLGVKPKNRQ